MSGLSADCADIFNLRRSDEDDYDSMAVMGYITMAEAFYHITYIATQVQLHTATNRFFTQPFDAAEKKVGPHCL